MEYVNKHDKYALDIENFLSQEASPINPRLFVDSPNRTPVPWASTPKYHPYGQNKTERKQSHGDPRSGSVEMFDSPEIQPPGSHSKFEHRVNLAYKMAGIANREYLRDPKSVAPTGLFET